MAEEAIRKNQEHYLTQKEKRKQRYNATKVSKKRHISEEERVQKLKAREEKMRAYHKKRYQDNKEKLLKYQNDYYKQKKSIQIL